MKDNTVYLTDEGFLELEEELNDSINKDKEGNIVEGANSESNIKIVGDYKKIDETVVDVIKEHPNAFFIKL